MSSSPSHHHDQTNAEASSSRSAPRQPYAEDDYSDNEADLLSSDPLNGDLGAK